MVSHSMGAVVEVAVEGVEEVETTLMQKVSPLAETKSHLLLQS